MSYASLETLLLFSRHTEIFEQCLSSYRQKYHCHEASQVRIIFTGGPLDCIRSHQSWVRVYQLLSPHLCNFASHG